MLLVDVGLHIYQLAASSQNKIISTVYQCEQKGRQQKPSFLDQVLCKIHWRQKIPPNINWVQQVNALSVPNIFSTPFPITCYHNLASYGEWCCYFWRISSTFPISSDKYIKFSVLHNAFTVFAYSIRGPPFRFRIYGI